MLHPNSNEGSVIDFYLFACNTFFCETGRGRLQIGPYWTNNFDNIISMSLFLIYFSEYFFYRKQKQIWFFFYSSSLGNEAAECTVCMVKLWVMAATDELFGSSSTFFWNKKSKQKLKQKSKQFKQKVRLTCETGRGRLQIGGKTGADRCGDGIFGCSSMGSSLIRSSSAWLGLKSGFKPGILSEFVISVFCSTVGNFA